jgi:transposase
MAEIDESAIAERWRMMEGALDERARRRWAAAEARSHGRGGIAAVVRATPVSESTVRRGLSELDSGEALEPGRVRRPGGGRKRLAEKDPTLVSDLERLVEADVRGDPERPLRWSSKSAAKLAGGLREAGHQVADRTVLKTLKELGYSLQANRKTREGAQHPDRDAQFQHINETVKAALDAGQPVISVDTKKKELVGDFKNPGREWRPKGEPELVRSHDFKDKELGKAIPYGIYDLADDTGWVNVGIDNDTAQFAVNSILSWWEHLGKKRYPNATTLTITPDCGGSNGNRLRLWKTELQRLAEQDRPRHPRLPLPSRHQQVEQNRAPPLQLHLEELAREAPDEPRSDHQPDRRRDDTHRPRGLRPTRPTHLPEGNQSHKRRTLHRQHPQSRLPPRMELQHKPFTYKRVIPNARSMTEQPPS